MKKILLTTLSALVVLAGSAQDIKQVKKAVDKKDWPAARNAIDLTMATGKYAKDPDAYYLKGKIYSQFATDSSLKGTIPGASMIALGAFDTAYSIDSTKTSINAALDKFAPIANLYNTTFNDTYKIFQKDDYKTSLRGFQEADSIGRFLYKKHLGLTALDTVVNYYMGFSAMKLQMNDTATYYFKRLADAKVSGQGFDLPYRWMVFTYSDAKDWTDARHYADIGKQFYPKEAYFDEPDLQMLKDEGKTDLLIAKYREVLDKEPNNYEYEYNFGNTLFGLVYGVDQRPSNYDTLVAALDSAFTKCIQIDPSRPEAYLALGKSKYNQAVDFNNQVKLIKGTTPDDAAKKKTLEGKAEDEIKSAISPLEFVFNYYDPKATSLAVHEKSNYKSAITLLEDCYRYIGNNDKAKYYDDKYTAADKM